MSASGYILGETLALIVVGYFLFRVVQRSRQRLVNGEGLPTIAKAPPEAEAAPVIAGGAPTPIPEPVTPAPPGMFDCSEMEEELEGIYTKLGASDAFAEAKSKVDELAKKLTTEGQYPPDEARFRAYSRSLDEHRAFVASKATA